MKLCNLLGSLYDEVSSFFLFFWYEIFFKWKDKTSELLKVSCSVSSYSEITFFLDFFLFLDISENFLLSSKVSAFLKKGKFIASSGFPKKTIFPSSIYNTLFIIGIYCKACVTTKTVLFFK